MGNDVLVRMHNITKKFPGVLANDRVNFELKAGEIHALVGENGAGKTTLMNILYGIYQPDDGEIYIRGRRTVIKSPKEAIKLGIGMVHQHFTLISTLTVAENIILGEPSSKLITPIRDIENKIRRISESYGLKVNPKARIWELSVGERQKVEIIKTLYRGAEILILDEPTSVLTPIETVELFRVLRRMADEGRGIVFITHKLDEVLAIGDRATILRRGRVVGTVDVSKTCREELAEMMIGRKVIANQYNKKPIVGSTILKIEDLCVNDDKGLEAVKNVSLQISGGEILGIAGVAGNGQRELAEAIAGLRRVKHGRIVLDGEEITNIDVKKIIEKGVAYIPEDRISMGIVSDLNIAENIILRKYRYKPYSNNLFLNFKFINSFSAELIDKFNIIASSINTPAKLLSGGNIQKLILARELSGNPKLIVAVNPTAGLDIVATDYVRRKLIEMRNNGKAILLVSEDLEEVISLSDRIVVMYGGRITGILKPEDVSIEKIGLLMTGGRSEN
jgi:simple sugar transport system ATP-binding protein